MNWTQEAEQMLEAAPSFVRAVIRERVQEYARRKGVNVITSDLLVRLRAELMPKSESRSDGIEMFFAREGVDPLEAAFESDAGPHPSMQGTMIASDDAKNAWNKASKEIDQSARRSLYVHVPFCQSRCSFCPFYTYKSDDGELATYATALEQEMKMVSALHLVTGHPIHSVYFGGGTPTDLSASDLYRLLCTVRERFPLANDCEITIEGRVSGFTTEKMQACIDGGANRFSIGVQSFDTQIRRGVGRKADTREILSTLDRLCSLDSAAIVVDMIYGLPNQTMETWESDIETFVNKTGAHGIDMYKLKMLPGTVLTKSDGPAYAPNTSQMGYMYKRGCEVMTKHGFTRLSNCHWARGTRERNRYNTDTAFGGVCIPIGCCAGGKAGNYRFFQESDLKRYYELIAEGIKPIASAIKLPEHSECCEEIGGQVALGAIDLDVVERYVGTAVSELSRLIGQWNTSGLLHLTSPSRVELTTAGRFWSNNIAQALITHLVRQDQTPRSFSCDKSLFAQTIQSQEAS